VDTTSLAQSPAPITPEDLERLLTAARAALRLLNDLDEHLPIDAPRLGNEGRIRKQLREAVRRCSYETRPCTACDGGRNHAPTRHSMERPRTIDCPECSGSGQVRVYSYGPPKKARRG
jgi:hypothetical protein